MDQTSSELIELNTAFYIKNAAAFSSQERKPRETWPALADIVRRYQPVRAIDLGSGNGRWFSLLKTSDIGFAASCCIDNNRQLLAEAKEKLDLPAIEFRLIDFISKWPDLSGFSPNLVTAFGVWHHIPTKELRVERLKQMRHTLIPPGIMIVSFWDFESGNFDQRKLIKAAGDHDYFIRRGNDTANRKYCHSYSASEVIELAESLKTDYDIIPGTGSDGMNRYLVAYIEP